jgi:predicted  nucleic acid-binding Zn-ribbon protein
MNGMKWFFLLPFISVTATATKAGVGPIQKVLQLMDELQSKIMSEGDAAQIAYEEFVDWCQKQAINTKHSIDDSEEQIEALQAMIDQAQAYIDQLQTEIGGEGAQEPGLTGKISKLEKELGAATDIRTKEKADFDALDKDLSETVDMLGRAEKVLAKHLGKAAATGALLQFTETFQNIVDASLANIPDKHLLQSLLQKAEVDSSDENLLQQPAQATTKAFETSSSPIVKTMADMREKAEASRAAAQKQEMNAAHAFAMYEQSSKDELASLQAQLDTSKKRLALNNEKKATALGKMETATKEKSASETYLADTQQECMEKASDFETASAERTEEVKTLMMAKKILLNQGKPALVQQPASFLQMKTQVKVAASNNASPFYTRQLAAANFLRNFDPDSWVLTQVSDKVLADPFAKVKDMLYGMIEKLEKEQAAESEHKAWCDKEMSKTTKQEKSKSSRLNEVTIRKEKAVAEITKLGEDLLTLQDDIQKLDEAVKESTKLRNNGAEEWAEESAEYKAGQEACAAAIKVLNNYYGSKKDAFLQSRDQLKGPSGIVGLLEVAESDFAKSLAEGQAAEDAIVAEYEKYLEDSKVSRATMLQDQKNKNAEKSRLDALIAELSEDVEDSQKDLDAVLEYLDKIKTSCETKTPTHEERQARRAKEIEGLQNALGILAGEDLGFLQKATGSR